MHFYFAYGSNLDNKQMDRRCPSSKILEVGYLKGYYLDFTRFSSKWGGGVADVVINKDNEVWGLVYEITKEDLKRLDSCEGYPKIYNRCQCTIHFLKGSSKEAFVYYVVDKKNFIPPTKVYLDIIKKAGKEHKFADKYLAYLDTIRTI